MPKVITTAKPKAAATQPNATVRGTLVEPGARFIIVANASCVNDKPTANLFFAADFLPLGIRDIQITSNTATEVDIEKFPAKLVSVHFKNVTLIRRIGPTLTNCVALVQALEFPGSGLFNLDIVVRKNGKPVFNFSRNFFGSVKVNKAVFCKR